MASGGYKKYGDVASNSNSVITMEKKIDLDQPNFGRYTGIETVDIPYVKDYFNDNVICNIQNFLADRLRPYEKQNRKVIVDKKIIISVMQDIITKKLPNVGSIYTHDIMPTSTQDDYLDIINRTIQVIYGNLKNEMEIEQNNAKLSVWSTLYGDFNKEGLRQTPPIKIKRNRPTPMLFNMNY